MGPLDPAPNQVKQPKKRLTLQIKKTTIHTIFKEF